MAMSSAFVCFCVDGQSDIDALRTQFEDVFDEVGGDEIIVDFRFANLNGENQGDITTLKGVDADNIEKMIYKYYFKNLDKSSDLGWADVTHIIHIIDLDGAYVSDEAIKECTDSEIEYAEGLSCRNNKKNTLYFSNHIAVRTEDGKNPAVKMMIDRNKRKRQVIEKLLTIDEITIGKKTVKYSLYYFSSNLDHFLYGKANLSGPDKMRSAAEFSRNYGDATKFADYFGNSDFSYKGDYISSWRDIKKGNNSLSRGTNVNLLIDRIINSELEDWF